MTCFQCNGTTKNSRVDVLIVEPNQTIIRQQQKTSSLQSANASPFKTLVSQGVDVDNFGGLIELQSAGLFGGIAPLNLSGDLIVNGSFELLPLLTGWDSPNAYYTGIPNIGVMLNPSSTYSIKQDITGDPAKYYKVSFEATTQSAFSVADGFIRIEIVDSVSGNIILDKTEFVNGVIGVRYYNVTGISQAEVRFYAVGRNISLINVSMVDGPLMYTNRVDSTTIYNFVHSNHGWKTASRTPFEFSGLHQIPETADGLCLSPNGNNIKTSVVLSLNTTNKSIDSHQPFIDGIIDSFYSFTDDIKDIDFGYENGLLTFYICTDVAPFHLKKFGIDGVVSIIPLSSPFPVSAIKKELAGNRLWVAQSNFPFIHEINLSNPFFPSTFSYSLDIDVKAMTHDPVGNILYSVGPDRSFLPDIKSSVYKTNIGNFGVTTKIFTVDGSYNSIECVGSIPNLDGSFQPNSARIIIGGDRSVPFGSGPDDKILIAIDAFGVVDWSYDIPEIQNIGDISAIQLEDGRRPGIKCLLTDPTSKSVYTIDVRTGLGFKHYYSGDAIASLQPYLRKASQAVEKDIPVNPNKWYVIDTDVVDNEWDENGPSGVWYSPISIYTSDSRLKNVDIGFNGPSIFNPGVNSDFYKKPDNLYSRILYRPSGNVMTLGFDSRVEPTSLIPRPFDDAKYAKIRGVSVSEIDVNNITLASSGQIKEIYTFDNSVQGWSLYNNAVYDLTTQSINLTASTSNQLHGYIEKEFNVRKFKKFKIGININRNNVDNSSTGAVQVSVNGSLVFVNQVGEYNSIVEKTGYFEAEIVPQVDNVIVRITGSSRSSAINYVCVVYSEPSSVVDPCAFQDFQAKLSFNGVPTTPFFIYDTAVRYTLRDYDDPSIRGTVTVPHRNKSYYSYNFGNSALMCYSWISNPVPIDILSYDQTVANTAQPGTIVNSSNLRSVLYVARNGFAINLPSPVLPVFDFSYPLYYENIPQRIVSGNPICTQHEDSQFYKPCVVESIEYLLLMSIAPNLRGPLPNLFGSGCSYSDVMNINIGYLKDDDVSRTEFNTSFDMLYSLQTIGTQITQPPYISMPQARWESFKVTLDLPSGTGVDQCTEPIEGFLIEGTADFSLSPLVMNQTGNGGNNNSGGCVVNVFVQTLSTGLSGPAVQRIELSLPDDGTWRIIYGDVTSNDVTAPLPYNASPAQIQLALNSLPSLGSGSVVVTGSFPVYIVTFNSNLGVAKELSILNNLTCSSIDLGFVNPGPYSYELPKPGPNLNVDADKNCDSCLPVVIQTVKMRRESLSAGCLGVDCSNSVRAMACRFVDKTDRFGFYKFENNTLVGLDDDYNILPGDKIVLLDKEIGTSNVPIYKISRSFSYS